MPALSRQIALFRSERAEMTDYVTAWRCIGCGRIDTPAPCIGICQDEKVEFVDAADHRHVLARLQLEQQRAEALVVLVRKLAHTKPLNGQWQRSFLALQDEALRTLSAAE